MVYNDISNELLQARKKFLHAVDLTDSIGMVVHKEEKENEGTIVDVIPGMAQGYDRAPDGLTYTFHLRTDAKFSDGHAKIGIAAGDHATILWPLLCGMARAKYYLLLAEPFTGEEAANMGIVSLAVDGDQLEAKSVEIATRLALQAPGATRRTRSRSSSWLATSNLIFIVIVPLLQDARNLAGRLTC